MLYLYRFFRWFAGFDLAIALASGNQEWISRARADVAYWEGELDKLEIQQ